VVSALALSAVGCAGAGAGHNRANEAEREQWLACHGGTVEGAVAQRARQAAQVVLAAYPAVHVRVLDVDRPAAYSWPDGTVVVSRGLVNVLPADELAACVAHELGHLISDGWLNPPAALTGAATTHGADAERRADAIAVQVLQDHGLATSSLPQALRKVIDNDRALSPSERRALRARIDQLEQPPHGS
jgi:Zn-dependent protease with chaperone function